MIIFRLLFLALLFFFHCSHSAYAFETNKETPCIIYLKGSCSAGKSTLIRSILNEWKEIEIIDEDSIMQKSYVAAVATRFPDEFACIEQAISGENLYHAIREKDVFFKKTASEEERQKAADILCNIQNELDKPENLLWKQQVSHSIDLQVLKQIQQAVEQQKMILLDSWYIKPKHLNLHFPEIKVVQILLYCPLKKAYERLLIRNKEALIKGDFSEKRYIRQLIGSFTSLYELSSQPQQAIEQIDIVKLKNIFSKIAFSLKDGADVYQKPVFTFKEISKPFFLKLQTEFLLPIEENYELGKVFYIIPKRKYDVILDSTRTNQQLIDTLKRAID